MRADSVLGTGGVRSLSVVLPARDEAETIADAVHAALRELTARGIPGEVLVVDDGSRDRTAAVVHAIPDPRVRLLRHARGQGYGAALRTGLTSARCGHVFFTDSDGQFDLAELSRLEPWAADYDLVVGYRAPRRDPWGRRLLGWAWSGLLDVVLELGVRDVDCAFKLLRRSAVADLGLCSRGAFVNGELLARARARGLTVAEVPVSHFPRTAGASSGARVRVVGRAVGELWTLGPELRRLRSAPASTGEVG